MEITRLKAHTDIMLSSSTHITRLQELKDLMLTFSSHKSLRMRKSHAELRRLQGPKVYESNADLNADLQCA